MRPLTYDAIHAIRTTFDHATAESVLFAVDYDPSAELWRFKVKGATGTVNAAGLLKSE